MPDESMRSLGSGFRAQSLGGPRTCKKKEEEKEEKEKGEGKQIIRNSEKESY